MSTHFEFLLEEVSMEAFLNAWLPGFLPATCSFQTHPFQGKQDLLRKLEAAYRIGAQVDPARSTSPSFRCLVELFGDIAADDPPAANPVPII